MSSRFALSVLLVATLSGLCLAGSIEDEFYRSIRSPSIAGLDDEDVEARQNGPEPPRDSYRNVVRDIENYLKVLSDNADGIEQSLKDLNEKVKKLDMRGQEQYNMYYAKKLLAEQRAAIEALQAGVQVGNTKPYADLLKQTDEYVRPQQQTSGSSSYRKKDQQRSESPLVHSGAYQALQSLKKL